MRTPFLPTALGSAKCAPCRPRRRRSSLASRRHRPSCKSVSRHRSSYCTHRTAAIGPAYSLVFREICTNRRTQSPALARHKASASRVHPAPTLRGAHAPSSLHPEKHDPCRCCSTILCTENRRCGRREQQKPLRLRAAAMPLLLADCKRGVHRKCRRCLSRLAFLVQLLKRPRPHVAIVRPAHVATNVLAVIDFAISAGRGRLLACEVTPLRKAGRWATQTDLVKRTQLGFAAHRRSCSLSSIATVRSSFRSRWTS
jgi:hypothetical protein